MAIDILLWLLPLVNIDFLSTLFPINTFFINQNSGVVQYMSVSVSVLPKVEVVCFFPTFILEKYYQSLLLNIWKRLYVQLLVIQFLYWGAFYENIKFILETVVLKFCILLKRFIDFIWIGIISNGRWWSKCWARVMRIPMSTCPNWWKSVEIFFGDSSRVLKGKRTFIVSGVSVLSNNVNLLFILFFSL